MREDIEDQLRALVRDWITQDPKRHTHTALAEMVGVTQPAISNWLDEDPESKRHHGLRFPTAIRIAQSIGHPLVIHGASDHGAASPQPIGTMPTQSSGEGAPDRHIDDRPGPATVGGMELTELYRLKPAADALGIARSTLDSAVRDGRVPVFHLGDGCPVVRLEDVKAWNVNRDVKKRVRKPKK